MQKRLVDAQRLARVGFWSYRPQTDTLEWSDLLYELYGLDPKSFAPTLEGLFALLDPVDAEQMRARIDRALATGQGWQGDLRIQRVDGEERALQGNAEVECDEDGNVVLIRGIRQDVTELRRSEQLLREAEEQFPRFV